MWSLDLEFGGYLLNSGDPDGPENRVTGRRSERAWIKFFLLRCFHRAPGLRCRAYGFRVWCSLFVIRRPAN